MVGADDESRKRLPERSARKRGGVSSRLEYIARSLESRDPADWAATGAALSEVTKLLSKVLDGAIRGDEHHGYFLAELLAFLQKKQPALKAFNAAFRTNYAKLESSRPATGKRSPVRQKVYDILAEASDRRRLLLLVPELREVSSSIFRDDDELIALPEFCAKPEEIFDRWVNAILFPRLDAMADWLRCDPEIAAIKQAHDRNGNFRIRQFKKMARKAAKRIGAMPRTYYFNFDYLPEAVK